MNDRNVSGITIASVTMLMCSAYNAVFHILLRFSHLLDTVRSAAELNTPFWKDIVISVYDLAVVFTLSSGMLAVVQLTAAVAGIICAACHGLQKKPLKSAALPYVFGIICSLLGIISVCSMILSRSSGTMLSVVLIITQLVVPLLFSAEARKFHNRIKEQDLGSEHEE